MYVHSEAFHTTGECYSDALSSDASPVSNSRIMSRGCLLSSIRYSQKQSYPLRKRIHSEDRCTSTSTLFNMVILRNQPNHLNTAEEINTGEFQRPFDKEQHTDVKDILKTLMWSLGENQEVINRHISFGS